MSRPKWTPPVYEQDYQERTRRLDLLDGKVADYKDEPVLHDVSSILCNLEGLLNEDERGDLGELPCAAQGLRANAADWDAMEGWADEESLHAAETHLAAAIRSVQAASLSLRNCLEAELRHYLD